MYIDKCVNSTQLIVESGIQEPINLDPSERAAIKEFVDIAEEIAGVKLRRNCNLDAPKGVNGRDIDNVFILEKLDWKQSPPARRSRKNLSLDRREDTHRHEG